jgi:hypothetical protein
LTTVWPGGVGADPFALAKRYPAGAGAIPIALVQGGADDRHNHGDRDRKLIAARTPFILPQPRGRKAHLARHDG